MDEGILAEIKSRAVFEGCTPVVPLDNRRLLHVAQPRPFRADNEMPCGAKPLPWDAIGFHELRRGRVLYTRVSFSGRMYKDLAAVTLKGGLIRKLCDRCMSPDGGDTNEDC